MTVKAALDAKGAAAWFACHSHLALPWQVLQPYRLRKNVVSAVFVRKNVIGQEIARVTSTTEMWDGTSRYLCTIGKEDSAHESLAEAMSNAESVLVVKGYEIVGRVVWT